MDKAAKVMNRDPKIEAFLEDDVGVSYTMVKTVAIKDIDVHKSQHNQARPTEAIIQEHKEHVRAALENGRNTGPLILFKDRAKEDKKFMFMIGDGNHRIACCIELEWDSYPFGAYVVSGATDLQKTKIMDYNSVQGQTLSHDDRLQRAMFLHAKGMSYKDAAKELSIPLASLLDHETDLRTQDRLRGAGVSRPNLLAKTVRRELAKIDSAPVFAIAANVALDEQFNHGDTVALVKKVNKANMESGESASIAVIEEERRKKKVLKIRTGGRRHLSQTTKTIKVIKQACTNIHNITPDDIRALPKETKLEANTILRDALKEIDDLLDVVKPLLV